MIRLAPGMICTRHKTMLADHEIERCIEEGRLGLTPYDPELLQPNSIDVRLGAGFLVPNPLVAFIDTENVQPNHMHRLSNVPSFYMKPGMLILGSTIERVRLPSDIVGRVEGKSSLGRLGLVVHVTAGFLDAGFEGDITLELVNQAPWGIKLHSGMTIAQLAFDWCLPANVPYQGSYQHQSGPVESQYRGVQQGRKNL